MQEKAIYQSSDHPGDDSREWIDEPRMDESQHGEVYRFPSDTLNESQVLEMDRLLEALRKQKCVNVEANFFKGGRQQRQIAIFTGRSKPKL